ncbi:hypothetical protein ASG43_20205 [Aureimonas sp. Leaf454]|uniref:AsmA family protein n=1 Tax=Aureimonas sp. Leaf454 TaxID=1736381 RepID=UPI0006F41E36|nr:AsmA-like C-terminal region-containing protein [Aureimonas sp. Leaf454]KQT52378.1 hypothetical protein ASG43_20205 [Aureimonas sp. Leaf454]
MRHLALGLVLLAALALAAALGFRQVALGADLARREVMGALSDLGYARVVASEGRTVFRLLPVPRLVLYDVEVGAEDARPALSVDRMTADLDLWTALFGGVRIERLVLEQPDLVAAALPTFETPVPKVLEPILARLNEVGEVEIRNGVLRSERDGRPLVSAAHIAVSWPAESASAELTGSYDWNGQPVTVSLDLARPLALLEGGASTAEFQMTSPELSVAFAGEAASSGRLAGRLTASLPSLGRAIDWLTDHRPAVPEIGPLTLAADLMSEDGRFDLARATVSIEGFEGRGALDLVFPEDRRPSLGGTLAFERLDLDGIAEALAPRPTNPLAATRTIPTAFVDSMDIDLRVSAERGQAGPLALSDLAGTVKMKDGVATLDIGDAELLGGRGQMRVAIDSTARPPVLKGSASARDVDASGLFAAFGLDPALATGRADVAFDAASPVTSWADLLRRHRLEVVLSARSGSVSGLDPQRLTTDGRTVFDPGTAPAALPFATLKAEIATWGSRMELRSLRLSSELGTIEASGFLLNGADEADLVGTFDPAPVPSAVSGAALTKPKPIGMTMRGSWPHPVVVTTAGSSGE